MKIVVGSDHADSGYADRVEQHKAAVDAVRNSSDSGRERFR